jgi:hypothetical protein
MMPPIVRPATTKPGSVVLSSMFVMVVVEESMGVDVGLPPDDDDADEEEEDSGASVVLEIPNCPLPELLQTVKRFASQVTSSSDGDDVLKVGPL